MKLAVAFNGVGQAPKVEDLAWSEGVGHDEELAEEANVIVWGGAACSSDEVGGSSYRRAGITLDTLPYLVHQLSQGRSHG